MNQNNNINDIEANKTFLNIASNDSHSTAVSTNDCNNDSNDSNDSAQSSRQSGKNAKKTKPNRKTLLAQWSKRNRERFGNKCAVCGSTVHVQCHHILPKEKFPEWQYEDYNAIALCAKHHKFGKLSAHGNPLWFAEWLLSYDEELYRLIMEVLEDGIESGQLT